MQKRRSLIKILVLSFLLSVVAGTQPAAASLVIRESRIQQEIAPGTTVLGSLEASNSSNSVLDIKLYWMDFEYQPPFYDGGKQFLPVGSSDYSCHDYISFEPKTLSLGPYEKRQVKYSISVPDDFHGGCDGVLFFELGANQDPSGKVALGLTTRIGAIFFLESTNKVKRAVLKDLTVAADSLNGVMVNEGDIVLFPQVVYYVMNSDGMVEDRGEVKKMYLPPGQQADFVIPLSADLSSGTHTMILTGDLQEGDSVVQEIDLSKDAQGGFKIVDIRN